MLDVQTSYSLIVGKVINIHMKKKKTRFLSPTSLFNNYFFTLKNSKFDKIVRKEKKKTNISSVGSLFPSLGNAYVLPEAGARCSGGRQHAALLVQLQAQQHFAL